MTLKNTLKEKIQVHTVGINCTCNLQKTLIYLLIICRVRQKNTSLFVQQATSVKMSLILFFPPNANSKLVDKLTVMGTTESAVPLHSQRQECLQIVFFIIFF